MIVTCVDVYVKEEHITDFIEASRNNHLGSIKESENRRFDIIQSADDPCYFVLYEAYSSAAGAAAHKETEHYIAWRDIVAPWMAKPRQGNKFNILFPEQA